MANEGLEDRNNPLRFKFYVEGAPAVVAVTRKAFDTYYQAADGDSLHDRLNQEKKVLLNTISTWLMGKKKNKRLKETYVFDEAQFTKIMDA